MSSEHKVDAHAVYERLRAARLRAKKALVEPAPPSPVEAPASRAGRNLPQAIGVGVALIALVIACLFIDIRFFVALVYLVVCGGMWELARAFTLAGIRVPLIPLLVGAGGMIVSAWTLGTTALLMVFALTCGAVFIWRITEGGGLGAVRDATAGVFVAAYAPFLASFVVLMARRVDGPWAVLTFIAVVVANDTGGYIAGVLFGKHPMAPSISPKKSWEGLAGSHILAALVGVLMAVFALSYAWWAGLLLGIVGVWSATVGDLCESLIKRDVGVKDMGSLLPGHGGIMDRVDSLIITAPVAYLILGLTA